MAHSNLATSKLHVRLTKICPQLPNRSSICAQMGTLFVQQGNLLDRDVKYEGQSFKVGVGQGGGGSCVRI